MADRNIEDERRILSPRVLPVGSSIDQTRILPGIK